MSRILRLITCIFGTVTIGFGINALVNPKSAVSFFELDYPTTISTGRILIDALLAVYGVRDIFMGIATYVAAYSGTKKNLGMITVAGGGVAFEDGIICKSIVGHGQWSHWGYAPVMALVGFLLMVL